MTPLMGLIIGYTCVGVFVAGALALVLDMFGLFRLAKDIRTKLILGLLVDVIATGVASFAGPVTLNPSTAKAQIANTAQQEVIHDKVEPLQQQVDQLKTPVYLQIADEFQRPVAKQLSEKFTSLGFNVRGTEIMGAKNSPSVSEVRYFVGNEKYAAYAQSIANAMVGVGVAEAKTAPSQNKGFGANIEVWLSPSVAPSLEGFTYAVAVNQDNSLKDALVHLQEMLLDKKLPGSYILYRPGDGYRTVRLFSTRDDALSFVPAAKEMNNTVEDQPKQLNVWCPKQRWNKDGKFFVCIQ